MIEPSIGRVVWYHPKPQDGDPSPLVPNLPYAALVTCWLDLRTVSLAIFDHKGQMFAREHVSLAQDEDAVEQGMAEWMPFQKGQAAKPQVSIETVSDFVRQNFKAMLERVESAEKSHGDLTGLVAALEGKVNALWEHATQPKSDDVTSTDMAGMTKIMDDLAKRVSELELAQTPVHEAPPSV